MNILNKEIEGKKKSQKFLTVLFFVLLVSWAYGSFSRESSSLLPSKSENKYQANKYSTAVYFNQINAIYEDVVDSMATRDFLQSYQQYWTNADVIELAKHTVIIEKSHERVRNIVPPNDLISIHQEILQAFELFRDAMPIYRTAIDKRDSQLYDKSMNMMLEGADKLDGIVDKFE